MADRMGRNDYIDLVENAYFGAMTRGDVEPILALFLPDATMTTFYGDTPFRRMRAQPGPGEEPLRPFFAKAVDTFDVSYSDFEHVVDADAQRIWSIYTLDITPKPDGPMAHLAARRLRNCNFFEMDNGRIAAVTAYFAHPPTLPAPARQPVP